MMMIPDFYDSEGAAAAEADAMADGRNITVAACTGAFDAICGRFVSYDFAVRQAMAAQSMAPQSSPIPDWLHGCADGVTLWWLPKDDDKGQVLKEFNAYLGKARSILGQT